ncbi:unnamed protein product [Prunus armeniaca]|uniref:AAA+ ATPase domain-containing protein n=1 Tax=Prunus armeniaca TaxID=36596 RepID=A0A6J5V1D0_PRUAR|nr:unnamed protein product [Prunus armeniaca]
MKYPDIYKEFGMNLETGFLLYGPPGCGKTLIAKAVANEAGANFIQVKGPELLNKWVEESEKAVRTLFSRARACTPCILFFDELLVELDGGDQRKGVIVVGATNRPDVMDPAVLRPGRFGKHIYVPLPSKDERGFILKALARNKPIDSSVDQSEIGLRNACENFTGADLAALMHEATMAAVEEKLTSIASSDSSPCTIKETHFEKALAKITPSLTDELLAKHSDQGVNLVHSDWYSSSQTYMELSTQSNLFKLVLILEQNLKTPGTREASLFKNKAISFLGAECELEQSKGERRRGWDGRSQTRTFSEQNQNQSGRQTLLVELDGGDQRKGVIVIGASNRPAKIYPQKLATQKIHS